MEIGELLAMGLEPQQLSALTRRPLPRRRLDRATIVVMTILRVYVVIAVPLVIVAILRSFGRV